MKGFMYILKCSDGSYYTGSTQNLELRIAQHQAGEGSNHTKKRLPVELVYYEEYNRIDDAFYREKQIQGWRREKKEALINGEYDRLPELAKSFGRKLPSAAPAAELVEAAGAAGAARAVKVVEPAETTNIQQTTGDIDLLKLPKTAFLCSRKVPASAVLKCYDWAIEQRNKGVCVISSFHSQLEKDVLHYLLKGNQPIIIALARGLKTRIEPELKKPLEQGRILIITPFDESVKRVSEQTADLRNKMMLELADKITVGYASDGGKLESLLATTEKEIIRLV